MTKLGFATEVEPCLHRSNWERATINGLVMLICGDCAYTLVLAEHLETGRLYWEEVPLEGDGRLADVAEVLPEVQGDEGQQRVQPQLDARRRTRQLVQVVHAPGQAEDTTAPHGEPDQTTDQADYEVLHRMSAGEVEE